jgi:hypothetical protein
MYAQSLTLAIVLLAAASQSASAQTFDALGNCVSSAGTAAPGAGLFTLQSQAVSSTALPAGAQLMSTRVVGVASAPAPQLSSFSTFGATSGTVGAQFISNTSGLVPAVTTFAAPTTFAAAPTTFAWPSTVALSAPQTVISTAFTPVASPGVAQVLANRSATADSKAAAAGTPNAASSNCCSVTLQKFSNRIDDFETRLARLEKLLSEPSDGGRSPGKGSRDEVDDLLGGAPTKQPEPPNDEIGDLLNGTVE